MTVGAKKPKIFGNSFGLTKPLTLIFILVTSTCSTFDQILGLLAHSLQGNSHLNLESKTHVVIFVLTFK